MTRKPILLIGAGGHARACIDVIEQDGAFQIAGLIGLEDEVGTKVYNYPVIGIDSDISELARDYQYALVCIGQIKSPEKRIHYYQLLKKNGFIIPTILSPKAYVSPHTSIGMGTIVMHGAIINAGAIVGANCIINSQSLVEHDVTVADHCHVATAASINSSVNIGEGTFIGSGSSIKQCLNIGERCLIGLGQNVFKDCQSETKMPDIKAKE